MKKLLLFIISIGFYGTIMAQTDAMVVEQHSGIADIFDVSLNLRINNQTDNDLITITNGKDVLATYARADVKHIDFDTKKALTESVERASLVAFYNATGGDNWTDNTNWCSNKPLSEWKGIKTNGGLVKEIDLTGNNLTGDFKIPIGLLGNLKSLTSLGLGSNNLTGNIPSSIGRLKELTFLALYANKLSGEIPKEIGDLTKLTTLYISNKDLSGSIPKEFGNLKRLRNVNIINTQISGPLPPEMGNLEFIINLYLYGNKLSGELPPEMGKLKNLQNLLLHTNNLTGQIPSEWGNMVNLEKLTLSNNHLTGEIPESFNNLTKLIVKRTEELGGGYTFGLSVSNNNLSGEIPSLFYNDPAWIHEWPTLLCGNMLYDLNRIYIPAPSFHVTDLDGNILDSRDYYPKHKLTAIFCWSTWCPFSQALMTELLPLYEKYKDNGLEIIGVTWNEEEQLIRDFIAQKGIKWKNFLSSPDNMFDYYSSVMPIGGRYPTNSNPEITLIDSEGRVVFYDQINGRSNLVDFVEKWLGEGTQIENYKSTDYSADGEVKNLQTANGSKDIKVVILGDGFSDRMIADGTYDIVMNKTKDALFTTEPIKSYRDKFTVYSVTTVSENEVFSETTHTALECYNNNSGIGGNNVKVMQYAKKAINDDAMDDAIIIVVLNSQLSIANNVGGICVMYQPEQSNTWGSGTSITYVPNITGDGGDYNPISFETVLSHEAVGHGFAKLGDEYVTSEEAISSELIKSYLANTQKGWWKNVDFTDNAQEIKWSSFITDERYSNEEIGVYEGGMTYRHGVYRPTKKSVMASDAATFNAPSREAIWYRLNKLTEADGWNGSHEDFIKFDVQVSRARRMVRTKQDDKGLESVQMHLPTLRGALPVLKNTTWRSEISNW